jgi:arsenate reductase
MNYEITIYHNPKCSKSRKVLEIIRGKNIEPTIILYLANKLSKTEVKNLLAKLGLPIRDILRTGEDEYKNNNLNNENLGDDELIDCCFYTRLLPFLKYPLWVIQVLQVSF